jgi:DNA-binding transcriptional MerR regulator
MRAVDASHVRKKLHVDALSSDEWNYLYGLYLADGYGDAYEYRPAWWSYRVRFFLQGDQAEIACKVASLLRKTGLNPHIERDPVERMIIVRVYSILLLDFLADGNRLKDDPIYRESFFRDHELLTFEKGLPFIAGLLDGDGRCQPYISKGTRSFLGTINKWSWSISQTTFPFLIDYITKFTESLSPNSVRVIATGRKRVANFHKSLIIAMLKLDIAKYSWKVTQWLSKLAELERERGTYLTVGEIARMFNVSSYVTRNWIKAGKLAYKRRTDEKRRYCKYFVSKEEVEQFRERHLDELKALERAKSEGVKLVGVAEILGIPYSTLRRWHRLGRFKAMMVREGSIKFLLVSRDEINRIRGKYLANRGEEES